jgi:hypothetical protein
LQARAHVGNRKLQFKQSGSDSGDDGSVLYTGTDIEIRGAGTAPGIRLYRRVGIGYSPMSLNDSLAILAFLGVGTNAQTGSEKLHVIGDSILDGNTDFSALTASRALALNASKRLTVSAATDLELGYLAGVSSAIQSQLNGKVDQVGVTGHTIALAKITPVTGTDGSITWNAQGLITGYVDPT